MMYDFKTFNKYFFLTENGVILKQNHENQLVSIEKKLYMTS